jgi:hypothetical protein
MAAAAFVGWTWHQSWHATWLQFNVFLVVALLISIRRERQGLEDEWPDRFKGGAQGDYLRYRGGPLDARPLLWPGTDRPMGQEAVEGGAGLLPRIEAAGGYYELNRAKRRYEWKPAVTRPD